MPSHYDPHNTFLNTPYPGVGNSVYGQGRLPSLRMQGNLSPDLRYNNFEIQPQYISPTYIGSRPWVAEPGVPYDSLSHLQSFPIQWHIWNSV